MNETASFRTGYVSVLSLANFAGLKNGVFHFLNLFPYLNISSESVVKTTSVIFFDFNDSEIA